MVSAKNKCILLLVYITMTLLCCSCMKQTSVTEVFQEGQTYKIAILGKEAYVYSDVGFMNGVEMAVNDLKGQVNIVWEHYDDNGDYEQGLVLGMQLAEDDSVLAVLTFQDFDVIDTLAPIYDDKKKPLISVQGCYESTLNKKYSYFFSDFTSAKDMGIALGKYAKRMDAENIVCSHTNTAFEVDEMKGFQEVAAETNLNIADMVLGPFTMNRLKSSYVNWKNLDVNAVFLAHYTYQDTDWILEMIRYLKEEDPNLLIMGDYSLNNDDSLQRYGEYMEGVVITAPYSVESSDRNKEFARKYEKEYGISISNVAIQSYDLIYLIGNILNTGVSSYEEFVLKMKSEEGYNGITGNIKFNEYGKLVGVEPQYLIVKNKRFEVIE